ncbi:MAG: hypothetical protein M3P18_03360 [Actinomycetota bacterium]|nr:hypothetical protein [Actinomycetota bacterium]
MTHSIEDRYVQRAIVDAIVARVTADLVRGLEITANNNGRPDVTCGRKNIPVHLRGEVHVAVPAQQLVNVRVLPRRHEKMPDHDACICCEPPDFLGDIIDFQLQDAYGIGPLEDGCPETVSPAGVFYQPALSQARARLASVHL